jgi:hypothetical protein
MANHAHAYIPRSNKDFIVTAVAVNDDGILYEPGLATLISASASAAELGQEVIRTLNRFGNQHRNLRDYKKSEWPAFRASGLRTIRAFEADYECIAVESDDRRLTMTRFGPTHVAADTVHIAAPAQPDDIARGLHELRGRMIQHATKVA